MSSALRTKLRETQSIPWCNPKIKSCLSFSVMEGKRRLKEGKFTPLRFFRIPPSITLHSTWLPWMDIILSSNKPSSSKTCAPD